MRSDVLGEDVFFVGRDYSRRSSLELRVEEFTQKHFKTIILSIFLAVSMYANAMMAKTIVAQARLGENCAVWASKSSGFAVSN